jgi:hypothetical protein
MKINLYMLTAERDNLKNIMRSFQEGILKYYSTSLINKDLTHDNYQDCIKELKKKHKVEVNCVYNEKYRDCDIAIQFGGVKDRNTVHHNLKRDIKEKAEKIVILETPILGRKINNSHDYNYYRLAVDGFLFNEGVFNYHTSNKDNTRWNKLKSELGYKEFTGWKSNPNGNILLLTQLPGDSSLRHNDTFEWIKNTVSEIRNHTDRKIVIRLHPAMSNKGRHEFAGNLNEFIFSNPSNIEWSIGERSLQQDLNDAKVTVSYTSGSAIDAVLHGVPSIAIDEGSFIWPISSHKLTEIENPFLADLKTVNQWLWNISYNQWGVGELESEAAWKYVLETIKE